MKTTSIQQPASSICGRRLLTAGLFLIGLMACIAVGISTAQAQTYNVKNMGILDGMTACEPAAMNDLGYVAGTATAGEHHAAFLYYYDDKEEEMKDVGGLGSRGFAINPGGVIVGDAYFFNQKVSHAALFNGGGTVDLGVLKGQAFSRATGMNAMRQVVGSSGPTRDSAKTRAFIWTSLTGMIDIGTLGGEYAEASAINDAGFITGTSQPSQTRWGITHAFIYQPFSQTERLMEPMRDLGTLGGNSSYGTAINASNHVVGYSTINNLNGIVHAFFHNGENMIDLGSLEKEGFYDSAALAVNNADQVVGVSYMQANDTGPLNQVGFIWRRDASKVGQMINLNTLIAPGGKSFWILSAKAINDSGQIAASAYDYANNTVCAVLLTPVK